MAEAGKVDVIVFGATGFTGKCIVQELIKFNQTQQELSWAIAGRNEERLRGVLEWASLRTGRDVSAVSLVIADCVDEKSLNIMASRARLIINCCGPYRFYGEPVVKACIENGTHHVDVSGEPEYMEIMQLNYHRAAEEKGVFIISACGFDSVPVDLGVVHFIKNFSGVVNSIESYMACSNKTSEPAANVGTWESLVNAIPNINNLRTIRRQIFSTLNGLRLEPRLKTRSIVHRSPVFDNKLSVLFPGSDKTVVLRSQQYLYTFYQQRPVQFKPYFIVSPFPVLVGLMIVGFFLITLSRFSYGRKLLLRYPEFFTLGGMSRKGPSEEARSRTYARFRFVGDGWLKDVVEKYEHPEQINEPTNARMVTEISFPDFAYGFTAKSAILSAMTILREREYMPLKGGVLTPGAAFAKTNFLENLAGQGVTFKILSNL